jgi:hypothetical protein
MAGASGAAEVPDRAERGGPSFCNGAAGSDEGTDTVSVTHKAVRRSNRSILAILVDDHDVWVWRGPTLQPPSLGC